MDAGEAANIITAVATSIGTLIGGFAAWTAYKAWHSAEAESAPDIGVSSTKWRSLRGEVLLEVELHIRNQSHRELHLHQVHFRRPKGAVANHGLDHVYSGTYHPTDFRAGAIKYRKQIGRTGATGYRGRPNDYSRPDFYLKDPGDIDELVIEVTYSLGTAQARRSRERIIASVEADRAQITEIPTYDEEIAKREAARAKAGPTRIFYGDKPVA